MYYSWYPLLGWEHLVLLLENSPIAWLRCLHVSQPVWRSFGHIQCWVSAKHTVLEFLPNSLVLSGDFITKCSWPFYVYWKSSNMHFGVISSAVASFWILYHISHFDAAKLCSYARQCLLPQFPSSGHLMSQLDLLMLATQVFLQYVDWFLVYGLICYILGSSSTSALSMPL